MKNDGMPAQFRAGILQTPTNAVPYPVHVRAEAFPADGEGERAAAEFQEILDHPGIVGNFHLAALARPGLARAYAKEFEQASCARSPRCSSDDKKRPTKCRLDPARPIKISSRFGTASTTRYGHLGKREARSQH